MSEALPGDRPPKPVKREPERMCVVTRQRGTADDLIRFVRGPDGTIVPDLKGNLPGRGAWVTATRHHMALAMKKGALARALDAKPDPAIDLADQVEHLMTDRVLGTLGLLRRAGLLVSGAAKVEAEVRKGTALFVLHAHDGAADGIRKITQARRAVFFEDGPIIPAINCFASAQLGLALGAENVIHAAAIEDRQSAAALQRTVALLRYRGEEPDMPVDDASGTGAASETEKDERHEEPQEDGTE